MRTFLVAVAAPNEIAVINFLAASPLGPNSEDREIDSWWIAEDDRHDGSDHDSAVFVPRGAQSDIANIIDQWMDSKDDEWQEEGYPYADTDVSGYWWPKRFTER